MAIQCSRFGGNGLGLNPSSSGWKPLGLSPVLCESQFPSLWNEDNNSTYSQDCHEDSKRWCMERVTTVPMPDQQ